MKLWYFFNVVRITEYKNERIKSLINLHNQKYKFTRRTP